MASSLFSWLKALYLAYTQNLSLNAPYKSILRVNLSTLNTMPVTKISLGLLLLAMLNFSLSKVSYANSNIKLESQDALEQSAAYIDTKQDNNQNNKDPNLSPNSQPKSSSTSNINLPQEQGIVYRDPFGAKIIKAPSNVEQNSTNVETKSNPNSSLNLNSNNQNLSLNQAPLKAIEEINNIAIIYFSQPENIPKHHHQDHALDIDVLSGASLIYDKESKQYQGIVEYVAHTLAQKLDAKVFHLDKKEGYPKEHDELIKLVAKEHDTKEDIQITIDPPLELNQYQTIMIGFPLWWQEMPKAYHALFKQFDFSGKTIIPFCIYSNHIPQQFFKTIKELEPNAKVVSDRALALERQNITAKDKLNTSLDSWLQKLNLTKPNNKLDNNNKINK